MQQDSPDRSRSPGKRCGVDLKVFEHQNIPETDHSDPSLFKINVHVTTFPESHGNILTLFHPPEISVGNNMCTDVERAFYGEL